MRAWRFGTVVMLWLSRNCGRERYVRRMTSRRCLPSTVFMVNIPRSMRNGGLPEARCCIDKIGWLAMNSCWSKLWVKRSDQYHILAWDIKIEKIDTSHIVLFLKVGSNPNNRPWWTIFTLWSLHMNLDCSTSTTSSTPARHLLVWFDMEFKRPAFNLRLAIPFKDTLLHSLEVVLVLGRLWRWS